MKGKYDGMVFECLGTEFRLSSIKVSGMWGYESKIYHFFAEQEVERKISEGSWRFPKRYYVKEFLRCLNAATESA